MQYQANPNDSLFEAIRSWLRVNYPQEIPRRVRIDVVGDPDPIILKVPRGTCQAAKVETLPARHSPDYRSVDWFGQSYTFTTTQAACVAALWEAWEQGTPTMGQEAVLEAAGSSARRLDHVFRDGESQPHPAWGTMIVPAGRGSYRLCEPK